MEKQCKIGKAKSGIFGWGSLVAKRLKHGHALDQEIQVLAPLGNRIFLQSPSWCTQPYPQNRELPSRPLEGTLSCRSQGTWFIGAAFSRPSLATIVVNPSGANQAWGPTTNKFTLWSGGVASCKPNSKMDDEHIQDLMK